MELRHLDLFSGIGGFALAAQMVGGIETKQFVEIDPYCQKVLSKNFPGIPTHGDITTFTAEPETYDIITGGYPCQDISSANPNGRGLEGERSGLFYELMRIVCECRPRYIVLENVAALLSKHNGRDMGAVLWELSESGYDAEWQVISAASVGAPHLRERVFIVAYPNSHCNQYAIARSDKEETSLSKLSEQANSSTWEPCGTSHDFIGEANAVAYPNSARLEKQHTPTESARSGYSTGTHDPGRTFWTTEPGVCGVADGIPNRIHRIRGLGNAVVPQVAAIALRRVLDLNHGNN